MKFWKRQKDWRERNRSGVVRCWKLRGRKLLFLLKLINWIFKTNLQIKIFHLFTQQTLTEYLQWGRQYSRHCTKRGSFSCTCFNFRKSNWWSRFSICVDNVYQSELLISSPSSYQIITKILYFIIIYYTLELTTWNCSIINKIVLFLCSHRQEFK